jgi:hypothetical protein
MAILKNCEIWFAKLNPSRPNSRMDPENPRWEVQLRTHDKDQFAAWKAEGLKPKLLVHPEGHEEEGQAIIDEKGQKTWRLNLGKNAFKRGLSKDTPLAQRKPNDPVEVVDGKMRAIDPDTIGNGSIANVRVFIREYTDNKTGKLAKAGTLMGLQLTKYIVYKQTAREEFDAEETEVIDLPDEAAEDDDGDGSYVAEEPAAKAPGKIKPPVKPVDERVDDAF